MWQSNAPGGSGGPEESGQAVLAVEAGSQDESAV